MLGTFLEFFVSFSIFTITRWGREREKERERIYFLPSGVVSLLFSLSSSLWHRVLVFGILIFNSGWRENSYVVACGKLPTLLVAMFYGPCSFSNFVGFFLIFISGLREDI